MFSAFLTFDYEIFFHQSGTVEKCLLEPTTRIAALLKARDAFATFFVDVMFIDRLLNDAPRSAERVVGQLRDLVASGHRLELHLHPHWLDATYQSGRWHFPTYRHYRLESLDDIQIKRLFSEGISRIESIARREAQEYKVQAFRAGGWCIQPFSSLLPAFSESGLRIDSSIAYGMKGTSQTHSFDFTSAPEKSFYQFSDNPLAEDSQGPYIEAAVSTYSCPTRWRIHEKLLRYGPQCKTIGDGWGLRTETPQSIQGQIGEILHPRRRFLSLDSSYGYSALKILDGSKDAVLVSHPKLMTPHSLESLETLLSREQYRFPVLTPDELLDRTVKAGQAPVTA